MGVEPQDVAVLKLLYLIRYVDDIPANLDNIVILMADDLRTDKITMREKVRAAQLAWSDEIARMVGPHAFSPAPSDER